ncbi:MAG TPA: DUF2723 domain-containing protein [Vicinamibacterales bacterium]|nr:DUF2723 domain-containing protein [Vicinamibacterales bacterium]
MRRPRPIATPIVHGRDLNRIDLVIAFAIAGLAGWLYVLTAARDIVVGDTAELAAAALTLGVAHAPGYPLLTLLGYLFSLFPFGPEPFRVTLVAVASGAGAAGLTFLTVTRLTASRTAAAAAALLLAVNPLVWRWSIVFESFPLNNLLAAAIVLLLAIWQARPERTGWLVAAAFTTGLALSNHLTIVLIGPAILSLLWRHRAVLIARPRAIGWCVAALAIGLLPYLHIPIAAARDPFLNTGRVSSLGDFVGLVTRADYGSGQLIADPSQLGGTASARTAARIGALAASFSSLEWLLGLLGVSSLWRRWRGFAIFSLLAVAAAGPAFMILADIDIAQRYALFVVERFFLLAHVLAAPFVGFGAAAAIDLARRPLARGRPTIAASFVGAICGAFAIWTIAADYREIDQSANHVARHYAEDILRPLDPDTILLATGDDTTFPVAYVQAVDGLRPDVTSIWQSAVRNLEWYRRQLREREPSLVVPFTGDPRSPADTIRALVEANPQRPVAFAGDPPADDSLRGRYVGFPRGLVFQLQPSSQPLLLDSLIREYERLTPLYRIPAAASIKHGTFEERILRSYAVPAFVIGSEYERAGARAEARAWFERALAIDPGFSDARQALARVRGT